MTGGRHPSGAGSGSSPPGARQPARQRSEVDHAFLGAAERRAADAVDADALVHHAAALVRIPSEGGRERPAQEAVAAWMADAGLEVDLWEIDVDELSRHPAFSAEIERDRPLGVVGTLRGTGGRRGAATSPDTSPGRTLILNGHVDVVPAGDPALWTRPPWSGEVADGRLWGRGALDMKGALVAGLFALKAVGDACLELRGDIHLQSVVGEEDGGSGTLAAILRGYTGDGAIVMEPTGLAVAPAQAGAVNFRLHVPGRAAHGAVREEGISALENLFPVYRAVQELEEERNRRLGGGDPLFARYRLPFPICIGTVRGGDWASSVPDHVTAEGRVGISPDEDPDEARRELEDAVAAAAATDAWLRDHPPRVEWWGGRFAPARTPVEHPLVQTVQAAAEAVLERPVSLEGMTYGADMGLLAGVGRTPTVLFGPGDIRQAHRPDESVAVADLVGLARALAVTAVRFCG